ncbi:AraC family transcriptional regulator [Alkalimarinus sediminis]|uniref:AraC family transcriptional regulator n=1 Tax=Alkalimarinus sediminis TaxID=1632866 RepID=A0A9E8KQX5_9ALTE|nr:AraC family transcriptional regulator [Alkalimarinus sediminis]UZW75680.1 AraC family transcriptional regulator [Alkalimarinus sediminis]
MAKLTVSEHFVKAALSGADKEGFNTKEILIQAGIEPDLMQQSGARVTGKQYTHLMQVIWNTMQDEYMGFASCKSKPGTFATMCYLTIHCNTLESVYKRADAFYNLFQKPVSMTLSQSGNQSHLTVAFEEPLDDPYHFLQESLLVIWHRFSCWLTGKRIVLDQVAFNYPKPAHADEYKHLFHCPLSFDQPHTQLTFNSRYLAEGVIRDEPELKEFLKSSPANLLGKPDDYNSFTSQIRQRIGRNLRDELPDFESIASVLNLSPQTLRRRLKEENTSYQEIKDNIRRDQSIYHLSRQDFSINEIAELVGFTEPSTFHRAFKKWTGLTPGAYRQGER